MEGSIPYLDFVMEYPPFALPFFVLPRLFTDSLDIYVIVFQVEIFIFNLLGMYLIYRIARRIGKAPWKMLAVYTLAVLAIGPIVAQQYDAFPAVMVLLSLYCFWTGRHKTSWVILALATMTKIFPAAIAPVFLLYYLRNREYRRIGSGILVFAATCLVVFIPFIAADPGSLSSLLDYHTQRGIQLESSYSSLALFAGNLGWTSIQLDFSAGSWNATGPLADTLSTVSTYLLPFLLLVSYWFIYRRIKPGSLRISDMGTHSLLIVEVVLIASKVLSPQYLIWLIPLIPLITGLRYGIRAVFIVIGGLTYYIFPWYYLELIDLESAPIYILLARNILLILLAALAGMAIFRSRKGQQLPEDG